ncbi:MAG: hypothetical protein P4L44_08300 [Oryzomonas sp.]|uniref:hypothetical protein n=1 Tax=Oryzomonas sp. TaxID=2855186 RepID=UPI00284CB033|nr:hypothetical protein [Oryzomonas sp.]MDR3579946.1 hypothetical protein [Oryzomonas sp.]
MRRAFVRLLTVSAVVAAAVSGCSREERQPPQSPATRQGAAPQQMWQFPQQKREVKAAPQDEADVIPVRDLVLTRFKAGDFEAIYRDASKGFREVGPKERFASLWAQQLEQTGTIKDLTETGHSTRPTDGFLIFTYRVQYERMPKNLSLTFGRSDEKTGFFGRSKAGKMELTGIHQTDVQNVKK